MPHESLPKTSITIRRYKLINKIAILICFFILFSAQTTTHSQASELTKISFLPQWLPQAQFAGYMVALEKGFYREAGIDLELMQGGPGRLPFGKLKRQEATFVSGWLSTAIQQRAMGLPVVNLAQILQRSGLMLVARKSAGITSLQSLNGKKVGLWGGDFRIQPLAVGRIYNLNVTVVPVYGTINLFLKGAVDAVSAMWYNEYHSIINSGINPDELTVFFFADLLGNFPEDGIYCLESTFITNPELCKRFIHASIKGWIYSFENKQEALEIVMKFANQAHVQTNRAHQRWMLARMQDLIMPTGDKTHVGKLNIKDYNRVGGILIESGIIEQLPHFDDFYRGS